MIPETYDQWEHCITVKCGIALTKKYVKGRLTVLRNTQDAHTKRFRAIYGDQHWKSTIAWFETSFSAIDK